MNFPRLVKINKGRYAIQVSLTHYKDVCTRDNHAWGKDSSFFIDCLLTKQQAKQNYPILWREYEATQLMDTRAKSTWRYRLQQFCTRIILGEDYVTIKFNDLQRLISTKDSCS